MVNSDRLSDAFGSVLKDFRKRSGVSQEALALEASLDRTYISLLERGLRQPTVKTVFIIAEVLNVHPHVMIEAIEQRLRESQN